MGWRVGQKAVCIVDERFDDPWSQRQSAEAPLPVRGAVYLVTVVEADPCLAPCLFLGFAEFPGKRFCASGFRPAVDDQLGLLAEIAARPPALPNERVVEDAPSLVAAATARRRLDLKGRR